MTISAVVALGSNLHQPKQQIQAAFIALARLPESQLIAQSSLYISAPQGYVHQPDFINAIALLNTRLNALTLLHEIQAIEKQFGRQRTFANAPRTLDLDLIDFGGQIINSAELTLPHPRATDRAFVLLPLAEIDPQYSLHGKNVSSWLKSLNNQNITLLDDSIEHPLNQRQGMT